MSDVTDEQLDARARAVAKMKAQRLATKIGAILVGGKPILVGEEITVVWVSDEEADESNDEIGA